MWLMKVNSLKSKTVWDVVELYTLLGREFESIQIFDRSAGNQWELNKQIRSVNLTNVTFVHFDLCGWLTFFGNLFEAWILFVATLVEYFIAQFCAYTNKQI